MDRPADVRLTLTVCLVHCLHPLASWHSFWESHNEPILCRKSSTEIILKDSSSPPRHRAPCDASRACWEVSKVTIVFDWVTAAQIHMLCCVVKRKVQHSGKFDYFTFLWVRQKSPREAAGSCDELCAGGWTHLRFPIETTGSYKARFWCDGLMREETVCLKLTMAAPQYVILDAAVASVILDQSFGLYFSERRAKNNNEDYSQWKWCFCLSIDWLR